MLKYNNYTYSCPHIPILSILYFIQKHLRLHLKWYNNKPFMIVIYNMKQIKPRLNNRDMKNNLPI